MSPTPPNQLGLLRTRRFLPLFATQFLGAFNDNLFKNALVILIGFRLASADDAALLITAAGGLFVLPFFLCSATAGQLADKLEKSALVRRIKLAEIGLMLAGAAGLTLGSVPLLLAVLFLMGAQSAFFGPLKYAVLPQHLREHELIGGNALFDAATFLAILGGTIAGGLLIAVPGGELLVGAVAVALAVAGWLTGRKVPEAPAGDPGLRIGRNLLAETVRLIRNARGNRPVFLAILGISWFWAIGSVYLTQLPSFVRGVLDGGAGTVTLLMATFSVGIAAGSLLCNRLLKGEVSARHLPWAAAAMGGFGIDLCFAGATQWRVLADLFGLAAAGGVFVVPLYAVLQARSAPAHCARNVAANNVLNAAAIVAVTGLSYAGLAAGLEVPALLLVAGAANLPVALYVATHSHRRLPRGAARLLALLLALALAAVPAIAGASL